MAAEASDAFDRVDTLPIVIPGMSATTRKTKSKTDAVKEQTRRRREQREWKNGESEDGKSFFTRRKWNDPVMRLLNQRIGPWFYVPMVYGGLSFMVIPTLLTFTKPDTSTFWWAATWLFVIWLVYIVLRALLVWLKMLSRKRAADKDAKEKRKYGESAPSTKERRLLFPGEATSINVLLALLMFVFILGIPALLWFIWPQYWGLMFVIGALSVSFAVLREWYRWRDLTIMIGRSARGVRITFGEPKLWILGFIGTGMGAYSFLEGSVEVRVFLTLMDKFIFLRSGDVDIASKLEGGNKQYLDNIPEVAELQEFLTRPVEWGESE